MSGTRAEAEARRKAILSRGTDRLNKLTNTARGSDAQTIFHNDHLPSLKPHEQNRPPTSQPSFTDSSRSPSPLPILVVPPPPVPSLDPSIFFESSQQYLPSDASDEKPKIPRAPSTLRKFMPLIHLVSIWTLLAYFVLWKEPEEFKSRLAVADEKAQRWWNRWGELRRKNPVNELGAWSVQVVPFFLAFITLEILLHSLRIFSGLDDVEPGPLIIILHHLPPPLPSIVMNGLKYFQMGGVFLNDLATALVGIGLIIMFASWYSS